MRHCLPTALLLLDCAASFSPQALLLELPTRGCLILQVGRREQWPSRRHRSGRRKRLPSGPRRRWWPRLAVGGALFVIHLYLLVRFVWVNHMNFEFAHNSLHLTQFSLTRIQFQQSRTQPKPKIQITAEAVWSNSARNHKSRRKHNPASINYLTSTDPYITPIDWSNAPLNTNLHSHDNETISTVYHLHSENVQRLDANTTAGVWSGLL